MKWSIEEKDILIEYYPKVNKKQILELLPKRTIGGIRDMAMRLNLKANPSICHQKYHINNKFFQQKTLEAAYFAGFIAADGCIPSRNPNVLSITVSTKDRIQLEKFQKILLYNGKIRDIQRVKQNKTFYHSVLELSSSQITQDLKNIWNITPRKSFTLKPPKIKNKKLIYAYIIGYFDGDGSWKVYTDNTKYKYVHYTMDFYGTKQMMTWIKKMLNNILHETIPIKISKKKNIFRFQISGKRCQKIHDKLNSLMTDIKLPRKWDIEEYKKFQRNKNGTKTNIFCLNYT